MSFGDLPISGYFLYGGMADKTLWFRINRRVSFIVRIFAQRTGDLPTEPKTSRSTVKGNRYDPLMRSANSRLSCNDTNGEIVPVHDFRYSITGISRLKFPVLIIRTCEPVTFLYTSG